MFGMKHMNCKYITCTFSWKLCKDKFVVAHGLHCKINYPVTGLYLIKIFLFLKKKPNSPKIKAMVVNIAKGTTVNSLLKPKSCPYLQTTAVTLEMCSIQP